MVKSMTGFGRCEVSKASRKYTVEVKSVNHRYLEVGLRMPKSLNFFEAAIRKLLKEYASRGKVDVFIGYEDESDQHLSLRYNEALASEYLTCAKRMEESFGLENDIRVSTLSRYPDVLTMEEEPEDEEELWNGLREALEGALQQFVESRASEGEHLKKDILAKLSDMMEDVEEIEKRAPEIISEYRKRLEEKVQELLGDSQIDENRLATELVIYADKVCTDEEIVRLKSHIVNMKETLEKGGEIGRKLDFIAQEMNRESNTILSKANDLIASNHAINLKTEIEKIREQLQNLE